MSEYWGAQDTFLQTLYNFKNIEGTRAPTCPPPSPHSAVLGLENGRRISEETWKKIDKRKATNNDANVAAKTRTQMRNATRKYQAGLFLIF